MKALNQQAYAENQRLKEELEDFSSLKSLEAIARNNLKMAGEDEVLVIINKPQPTADSSDDNIKNVKHKTQKTQKVQKAQKPQKQKI